jgi:hypothetical protein
MKLTITHSDINSTPFNFLRSAGYIYIESRQTGQGSFSRPLGSGHYPRFHVYVDEDDSTITFNLHLDQKQASYEGTSAHSGEYDGETVAQEIQRLKNFLQAHPPTKLSNNNKTSEPAPSSNDPRSRRFSDILRNM